MEMIPKITTSEDMEISEGIPIELLQKGIKISEKEEIEGSLLNGKIITLNAKGMIDGLRGEEDGMSFFGTDKKNSEGKNKNDHVLKIDNSYSPNITESHIFVIYFRRDLQNYYIDNFDENKEKYFLFVLLENPFPITEGEDILVSVLDYNFKLSVDKTTKNLNIQYGQGGNLEKATFSKDKSKYLMGRKSECNLVINDPSFSREQAMFTYQNGCWFIQDGGCEALSRTGTWLFIDKPFCIKKNITFKLGPSLMKIELQKQ